MDNNIGTIINAVAVITALIIFVGVAVKVLKDRLSEEKSVKAEVTDKNEFSKSVMSKAQAPHSKKKYIIVFDCMGKKKSFYVSELSYEQYKKGDKGILKYKGSRLIDFSR